MKVSLTHALTLAVTLGVSLVRAAVIPTSQKVVYLSSADGFHESAPHNYGVVKHKREPIRCDIREHSGGFRVRDTINHDCGDEVALDPRHSNVQATRTFQAGIKLSLDKDDAGALMDHLNHACQPNLVFVEADTDEGEFPGAFWTTRNIAAGDELTIDYGSTFFEMEAGELTELAPEEKYEELEFTCCCDTCIPKYGLRGNFLKGMEEPHYPAQTAGASS